MIINGLIWKPSHWSSAHRQFLEVVKAEIDRVGVRDINNVQAMILYNVGTEELTVGELAARLLSGLQRLVQSQEADRGGVHHPERLAHDRRSVRISLGQGAAAARAARQDRQRTRRTSRAWVSARTRWSRWSRRCAACPGLGPLAVADTALTTRPDPPLAQTLGRLRRCAAAWRFARRATGAPDLVGAPRRYAAPTGTTVGCRSYRTVAPRWRRRRTRSDRAPLGPSADFPTGTAATRPQRLSAAATIASGASPAYPRSPIATARRIGT
jgi:hypothetical protein